MLWLRCGQARQELHSAHIRHTGTREQHEARDYPSPVTRWPPTRTFVRLA